jgi:hypothetical protein
MDRKMLVLYFIFSTRSPQFFDDQNTSSRSLSYCLKKQILKHNHGMSNNCIYSNNTRAHRATAGRRKLGGHGLKDEMARDGARRKENNKK